MLSVHPLGKGDGSYAIGELFLHFLCFPACPQLLRFSLSRCYLPSLSLHLLANRGGWWAGLPFGACAGHSGRTPMLLCLPGADGHLWLFNPFPSLTDGLVCMTHKVIPTPVLTYLAVIQRGFTGSSPGNTVFFFFWAEQETVFPAFCLWRIFLYSWPLPSVDSVSFPGWPVWTDLLSHCLLLGD